MDNKTYQGQLGETKAAFVFANLGYYVYHDISGKSPVDLIIYKDGDTPKRVQVKTSTQELSEGTYQFELKRVRMNSTESKLHYFDPNDCDLLFLYAPDIDKYEIMDCNCVVVKSAIRIKFNTEGTAEAVGNLS